nr:uncharacterized protein LOC119177109 [Rhipicephalus microplus]
MAFLQGLLKSKRLHFWFRLKNGVPNFVTDDGYIGPCDPLEMLQPVFYIFVRITVAGITDESDKDYEIILPNLPTGRIVVNTVFLHGDIRVRPFKVEDFRDALDKERLLPDVIALGAYQINHVWAVTFNSQEATKRLTELKELQVKGRRCLVIDPQEQKVRLRLHWLLHGVSDEDVHTALAAFGKITEVTRERWRVEGVNEKNSTTRTVFIKLKSGMKVEDLPHQIRFAGELALVVAPGRPMQCLRCSGTGHVRRECKVPRCSRCRRFGHGDAACVRSYAAHTQAPLVFLLDAYHILQVYLLAEADEKPSSLISHGQKRFSHSVKTTSKCEQKDQNI